MSKTLYKIETLTYGEHYTECLWFPNDEEMYRHFAECTNSKIITFSRIKTLY